MGFSDVESIGKDPARNITGLQDIGRFFVFWVTGRERDEAQVQTFALGVLASEKGEVAEKTSLVR